MTPDEAFVDYTKRIISERKIFAPTVQFDINDPVIENNACAIDSIWTHTKPRCGEDMQWREWLINGVFPLKLYIENNSDLQLLMKDVRFYDPPRFSAKDAYNSFIGRMSRKRELIPQGFLQYAIERWKNYKLRPMPSFYFDIESPEWVWQDTAKNKSQPKSWHSSVSCVMNISLRWDSATRTAHCFFILKHNQWSHFYGDVFGSAFFFEAFLKEVGLTPNHNCVTKVHIWMISSTLDKLKDARYIIESIEENKHASSN